MLYLSPTHPLCLGILSPLTDINQVYSNVLILRQLGPDHCGGQAHPDCGGCQGRGRENEDEGVGIQAVWRCRRHGARARGVATGTDYIGIYWLSVYVQSQRKPS